MNSDSSLVFADVSENASLTIASSFVGDNELDNSLNETAAKNDSSTTEDVMKRKIAYRNKVAIQSDSDSDCIVESDLDESLRNNTHMISSRSIIIDLSSSSGEDSENDDLASDSSLNPIENKVKSNIENGSFHDASKSADVQQSQSVESPIIKEEGASFKSSTSRSLISNVDDSFEPEHFVTPAEYNLQSEKVAQLKKNLSTLKASMVSVDLTNLGDNGKRLLDRKEQIKQLLEEESVKLAKMKISTAPNLGASTSAKSAAPLSWAELQRDAGLVQPQTFGKQALKTVETQHAMTMEGLRNLHSSLEERPGEDVMADTPAQCVVQLMQHQRHALAFMIWREKKQPSGGLLADDMGLGKTLTVITLCLATLAETRKAQKSTEWKSKTRNIRPAGVLVVCPASVMGQWVHEVKKRVQKHTLDVLEYHGTNRHEDIRLLHRVDIVLTTYATLTREYANHTQVYELKWRRVVLDEAHQVRNYKTQASEAVCALRAQSRWALTGTPIHNQEIDMFGLMKYLHCEPFDDLAVWKRWVGNKRTGGNQRLQSALQALMLRRTKADMIESGALCKFPERELEMITVKMDRDELLVYNKLMVFSRTLFAQFLHQRAEKYGFLDDAKKYDKVRKDVLKINQYKEVKQAQILVLLLRLRQICIHPNLMVKMLETTDIETIANEDPQPDQVEMLDVLDQLNKLKLRDEDDDEERDTAGPASDEPLTFNDAVTSVFSKEHPVFHPKRKSSKIRACLELLNNKILPTGNKAIIVSQWTSLLKLIAEYLKEDGIQYCSLDGSVKISDRQGIIDQLNNPKNSCKIMLLSLTAGGVGLNLIGANHLLILDPHWNPQLELQAQDRIYRMGQEKKVHIYRLLASDSIEERIMDLQKNKLEVAQAMLTGGRIITGNKLTLNDLKLLFNM